MLVSEILKRQSRPVETVLESQSMQEAIDKLVEKRIGSLLVKSERGKVAGIVTERDILRNIYSRSRRPENVRVGEIMTAEMITGGPCDSVNDLLKVMTKHRIRHLPIMSGTRLEGLVSIGDLVATQFEQVRDENHHLKEYITVSGASVP